MALSVQLKRQINRNLYQLHRSSSRSWFFEKCLYFKVVPRTLSVKPPRNEEAHSDPALRNQYQNAATSASIKNLRIALCDARKDLVSRRAEFSEFVSTINTTIKSAAEDYIKAQEPQIKHKMRHTFNQKLQHLKYIHGIVVDSSNTQLSSVQVKQKPNSGRRRFMKRWRFRRWKRREAARKVSIVHNYSDFSVTDGMSSLLNKGLGFVPTPGHVNKTQLITDLCKYERTMRWREFHAEKDEDENNNSISTEDGGPANIFPSKKTNLPTVPPSQHLTNYLGAVRSDLIASCGEKSCKSNLSPSELQALRELKKEQNCGDIVIKPADKGGGVCILKKSDYINELNAQLQATFKQGDSEIPFYAKAQESELRQQQSEIKNLIDNGHVNQFISDSDKRAMQPSGTAGRLYGLPKCHKKIPEGKSIPPLRPIISNSGANTEQISHFVDHHAKAEMKKIESYVEDTPHLLRIIEQENQSECQPIGAFPVSVDVSALYTSIPAGGPDGGMAAFEKCMDQRADKTVPTWYLMALLQVVLLGNIFEFNGAYWRQKIGTAMGTKCAPVYACLFMSILEKKILSTWTGTRPHLFKRYIDDIFFIWHGTVEELQDFLTHMNSCHPYIKFTSEYDYDKKTVAFLDMSISIDQGKIVTDLHKKDTARVQYLLPSSCNPGHVTKNIPFSCSEFAVTTHDSSHVWKS